MNDAGERVADGAAGYAAGFAAGCDTSELGRLYRIALQERDAAETAAQALGRRLKASLPPRCCASGPVGALFEESTRETAYPEP
jgi:hypothetical protein